VGCIIIDTCGITWQTNDLDVTVHPRPTITISGDTLTCSPAFTYQWYLNDSLLPADTLQKYIVIQAGQYKVYVVDTFGCNVFSSVFHYVINGIENPITAKKKLLVIPNPSDGNFVLSFIGIAGGRTFALRIFDISGKLVDLRNSQVIEAGGTYTFTPNAKMAVGSYLLEAEFAESMFRESLLITE
jgi:hypothetical protein